VSVTVTPKAVPAVCDPMEDTTSFDAAAAVTVTDALVPAVSGVPD